MNITRNQTLYFNLLFFLLTCPLVFIVVSPINQAHSEVIADRELQEFVDSIMSPFCPGRTLAACPSGTARELRLEVKSWLDQGMSTSQVRERLIEIYGTDILGVPSKSGFGLMAWIIPSAFLVLGLFLCILIVRRLASDSTSKTKLDTTGENTTDVSQNISNQLEQAIKERLIKG
jgi:cytochrome c-type biogenesis protein CcmH/NrfF